MSIARLLRTATIAAGAIAAVAGLGAAPASAQLFWDWGGGGMVGGSGRESVRFSPQFKKGEIIVSFGDRRLYFIAARARPSATRSPFRARRAAGPARPASPTSASTHPGRRPPK